MKRSELIAALQQVPGKDPEVFVEVREPYDEDAEILSDPVEHVRYGDGAIMISAIDEDFLAELRSEEDAK